MRAVEKAETGRADNRNAKKTTETLFVEMNGIEPSASGHRTLSLQVVEQPSVGPLLTPSSQAS